MSCQEREKEVDQEVLQKYLTYAVGIIVFPWVFLSLVSAVSQMHPAVNFNAEPVCDSDNRFVKMYFGGLCSFGQASEVDCHAITRSFRTALDGPVYHAAIAVGVDEVVAEDIFKKLRPNAETVEASGVRICGPAKDANSNIKQLFSAPTR